MKGILALQLLLQGKTLALLCPFAGFSRASDFVEGVGVQLVPAGEVECMSLTESVALGLPTGPAGEQHQQKGDDYARA